MSSPTSTSPRTGTARSALQHRHFRVVHRCVPVERRHLDAELHAAGLP